MVVTHTVCLRERVGKTYKASYKSYKAKDALYLDIR